MTRHRPSKLQPNGEETASGGIESSRDRQLDGTENAALKTALPDGVPSGTAVAGDRQELETVIAAVREAWEAGDRSTAAAVIAALHLPDQADVVEAFDVVDQGKILQELDEEEAADILQELEDENAADLAATIQPEELAPILDAMESDEAADVLGDLEPYQVAAALSAMDATEAAEVRALLGFSDESAGGRMVVDYVALHASDTASDAIEQLRRESLEDLEWAYYLYVIDRAGSLVGVVSLRQLVTSGPDELIGDLMDTDVIQVSAYDDQEAAARLMARYDLLALPVVDSRQRLLGVITHDDLVDVLEEEATEDMYRLVGVNEEQRHDDPVRISVQRRLPWLVLNLGAQLALVGALKAFEPTIARVAALAVLFPLVTGQGGNVGAQTTTIVVRSLALGEVERRQLRLLAKEATIGLINGLVVGILSGIIAYSVTSENSLAALIAGAMVLAMTLNLAAGALVGTLVPLTLRRLGLDPAVASAVLVTTATDTMGVIFFLGIFAILAAYL